MKKQLHKSYFTLVEVLIAMGICVVGVVSIMGLFPVGANTARDANMAFYADQAADQMLHFTKYAVQNAKDSSGNFDPVIFYGVTGGWFIDDTSTYENPLEGKTKEQRDAFFDEEHANWSEASSVESDPTFSGKLSENYKKMLLNSGTEIKNYSLNLYRIGFIAEVDTNGDGTIQPDEKIEDFACIVRMWAEPMLGDASTKLPRSATFNIEVSWPADLTYERRQKAEYSIDVFVPEG